jgi:hypothetical protein
MSSLSMATVADSAFGEAGLGVAFKGAAETPTTMAHAASSFPNGLGMSACIRISPLTSATANFCHYVPACILGSGARCGHGPKVPRAAQRRTAEYILPVAGVKLYLAERRRGNGIHDDEFVKFMN